MKCFGSNFIFFWGWTETNKKIVSSNGGKCSKNEEVSKGLYKVFGYLFLPFSVIFIILAIHFFTIFIC